MSDDCIDDVGVTQDVTEVTSTEDTPVEVTISEETTTLDISCDEIVVEPTNELFTVDTYDEVVTVDVTDEVITITTDCAQGPMGPSGDPGPAGAGLPTGGTAGQVLAKKTDTDFDDEWIDAPGGAVDSVNGQTGIVTIDANDVGADIAGSALNALIDANTYTDDAISAIDYPVDSVNGQTGVVVLDSTDVGADALGSAATALTDANTYTDTEISNLTFLESVVAGAGIIIDVTDPQNPIITATALPTQIFTLQNQETTSTYAYVGYESADNDWYIYRRTRATNLRQCATGVSSYSTNWTNRGSLTYV